MARGIPCASFLFYRKNENKLAPILDCIENTEEEENVDENGYWTWKSREKI